MTVINFIKKAEELEPMVWVCDCGNCSFLIYMNGNLECAECNSFVSDVTEHYQAIRKWTRKATKDNNFQASITEESRIDG